MLRILNILALVCVYLINMTTNQQLITSAVSKFEFSEEFKNQKQNVFDESNIDLVIGNGTHEDPEESNSMEEISEKISSLLK